MAIKNKDGTTYRLRGPNPLLKEQHRWTISEAQFYNFSWKHMILPAKKVAYEAVQKQEPIIPKIPKINIGKTEVVKVQKQEEQPIEIQLEEIEKDIMPLPEPITQQPQGIDDILKDRKTRFICLPVRIKSFKDDLYGDSYRTATFGEKFTFEGIILQKGDLGIRIWSPKLINQGSVICYDPSEILHDRDWWKVSEVYEKTGGYVLVANISDYSPDMS